MKSAKLIFPLSGLGILGTLGATAYTSYYLGSKNSKVEKKLIYSANDKTNRESPSQKDKLINKLESIKGKYLISNYNKIFIAQKLNRSTHTTKKYFYKIMKNFLFDAIVSNNIDISFNDLNLIDNINKLDFKFLSGPTNDAWKNIYDKKDDDLWKNVPYNESATGNDFNTSPSIVNAFRIRIKIKNSKNESKEIFVNILWIYSSAEYPKESYENKEEFIRSIFNNFSKSIVKKDASGKDLTEKDWIYYLEIPKTYYFDSYYTNIAFAISAYLKNSITNVYSYNNFLTSNLYRLTNTQGVDLENLDFGNNFEKKLSFKIRLLFNNRRSSSNMKFAPEFKTNINVSVKFV